MCKCTIQSIVSKSEYIKLQLHYYIILNYIMLQLYYNLSKSEFAGLCFQAKTMF